MRYQHPEPRHEFVTPDKSRYRTNAVLELRMYDDGVYRDSGRFVKLPIITTLQEVGY